MSHVLLQIPAPVLQILTLTISPFPTMNFTLLSSIFSHSVALNLELKSISYSQLLQSRSTTLSHVLHFNLLTFLVLFGHICRTHQPLQLPSISLSTSKTTKTLFSPAEPFYTFTLSHLTFPLFILIAALLSYLFLQEASVA